MIVNVAGVGEIEFPDSMSDAEIKAVLDSKFSNQAKQPEAKPEGHSKAEGVINAAGQGLTFGFADEAQAALLATIGVNLPESMGGLPDSVSIGDAYKGIRDELRGRNQQFRDENPKTALAAELAGGLATGGLGAAKTGVLKGGQVALNAAKAGAVAGGVAGAGYSEGETLGEVAVDTAKGAIIGGAAGGTLGYAGQKIGERVTKNKQLQRILETNPDGRVAGYALNAQGKLIKDKVAREAIDQGFDQGVVGVIKNASPADKSAMRKMVNIYRQGRNNPVFATKERPLNVVGESVAKRYRFVSDVNRKAGSAVGEAAEALKGQQVDVNGFVDDFIAKLDTAGVKLSTKGKVTLDFRGSDFEGLKDAQKVVSRVANRMLNTKTPDAHDVHRLKKFIDNNVTYGPGGKTGAVKQAEGMIKDLRHNMDGMLDGLFPEYDEANKLYKATKDALDDVNSLIGKSSNAGSDNFDKTLGTLSRRITSNAMSGGRVDDAFFRLTQTAENVGGKFSDDLDSLLVFANELDRVLPTQARTAIQGVTENVAGQAARAATGPKTFITEKVMGALSKSRDEETRLRALRELLTK